ncbi:MAG TPA: NAD(P)H-hydrate dehydratase [Longimicrobium sp.]|nr:NAD(P)H-hydrate dehydratase [Longimicrobium sp.]
MKRPQKISSARLRRLPLPPLDPGSDKDARGQILVVGGCPENPGGLILAGEAALRAGAGKLQLATVDSVAGVVAVAVPEARVFGFPGRSDGIHEGASTAIAGRAERVDALLIGPGLVDEDSAAALTRGIVGRVNGPAVVLDAGGLAVLRDHPRALEHLGGRAVLTPHAGEMAQLLGMGRDAVEDDPEAAAQHAAEQFGAVVALKGPATVIAAPDGSAFRYEGGSVGLGTSGSGDVLAGLVAGLLAGGAEAVRAAAWGVFLHGEAGNELARRFGAVGFLARELAREVPAILHRVTRR